MNWISPFPVLHKLTKVPIVVFRDSIYLTLSIKTHVYGNLLTFIYTNKWGINCNKNCLDIGFSLFKLYWTLKDLYKVEKKICPRDIGTIMYKQIQPFKSNKKLISVYM